MSNTSNRFEDVFEVEMKGILNDVHRFDVREPSDFSHLSDQVSEDALCWGSAEQKVIVGVGMPKRFYDAGWGISGLYMEIEGMEADPIYRVGLAKQLESLPSEFNHFYFDSKSRRTRPNFFFSNTSTLSYKVSVARDALKNDPVELAMDVLTMIDNTFIHRTYQEVARRLAVPER